MTEHSSEPLAVSPREINEPMVERRMLIFTAWLGTLLLSKLPLVIARDLLGSDIPWITPGWIVIAILLIIGTFAWTVLKPLRAYFAIMGVIILVPLILRPLITQSSIWSGSIESQHIMIGIFGDRVLLVLDTLIVLAALFLVGVKRREAFLRLGNMNAPFEGQPSTTTRNGRLSWSILGTGLSLLLAGLFFLFLVSQNPAALTNISAAIPWIPLILISAALNAFGEETQFRAAPLATLLQAVGPKHAIWLTSLWFGFGHYYGGFPSGPFGLIYSGGLALLMGKAMLDTRGMGWSWIIHVSIDTVIYIFMAATAV